MANLCGVCGSFLASNEGMLDPAYDAISPNNGISLEPLQAIETGRYVDLESKLI
jgi:hypothetical protein